MKAGARTPVSGATPLPALVGWFPAKTAATGRRGKRLSSGRTLPLTPHQDTGAMTYWRGDTRHDHPGRAPWRPDRAGRRRPGDLRQHGDEAERQKDPAAVQRLGPGR